MATGAFSMYQEMAYRSKYRRLYTHLRDKEDEQWLTSFREIEAILGFRLPASARRYRPWWANQKSGGHSQADYARGWTFYEVRIQTAKERSRVDGGRKTLRVRRYQAGQRLRDRTRTLRGRSFARSRSPEVGLIRVSLSPHTDGDRGSSLRRGHIPEVRL